MQLCKHCVAFVKKSKLASKIDLSRSFTKVGNELHLGFNCAAVCSVLPTFVPDTVIFAGNGAVEISGGGDCWDALEGKMKEEGLIGDGKYQNGLDALTWLASQDALFSKTLNPARILQFFTDMKTRIIQALIPCETSERQLYCHQCQKHHNLSVSEKILILTTNWDLGLFKKFPNVIQLHGRCDYPEQAVLPLQDITSLMLATKADLEKLNCGVLPGPFLEQCLNKTKNFIFWGTGLNDYDALLWHFLRGFLAQNHSVKVSVAARNKPDSFKSAREKVMRLFPPLQPKDCLCDMLP